MNDNGNNKNEDLPMYTSRMFAIRTGRLYKPRLTIPNETEHTLDSHAVA